MAVLGFWAGAMIAVHLLRPVLLLLFRRDMNLLEPLPLMPGRHHDRLLQLMLLVLPPM